MRSAVIHILRRIRREESGQSLIVVAFAMVVVIGISAMAIDVSSWYVKHHQAQVVADAAALAAANCLANPNKGPAPQCTSGTDTTDATTVAENYGTDNGVTLTASQISINTTTDRVTVNASKTGAGMFSKLLGINSTTETAGSTAGWAATASTVCTAALQAAGDCYAIYAANQTCGSNNGFVAYETSEQVIGAIHSQGSLNISDGSFAFLGPITYSTGNCTYTQQQNATIASGGSYYTPTGGDNEPANYWPMDYSTVFPACSATGTYQCTSSSAANGVSGSPSYCTYATTSPSGFTFGWVNGTDEVPIAGSTYCSIGQGSGVSASNPATWNGAITFSNGATLGSSSSPLAVTFIGGYVNATSSTLYLKPAVSNCLVYATDADSAAGGTNYAIEFENGTYNFTGTLFAPKGTISLNSTSSTAAFLEAQNVDTVNLSFQGDGPVAPGTSSSSTSGTDSLVQ